jgi:hypothetical protein
MPKRKRHNNIDGPSRLLAKQIVMLDEGTRISLTDHFEPAPLLVVTQGHVYTNAYWRHT